MKFSEYMGGVVDKDLLTSMPFLDFRSIFDKVSKADKALSI